MQREVEEHRNIHTEAKGGSCSITQNEKLLQGGRGGPNSRSLFIFLSPPGNAKK